VPALVIFFLVGMLAGSEEPGGVYFDDYRLAEAVGVVCLALILYAGGLDTLYAAVRPVLRAGVLLSTLRVVLTALGIGAVAAAATDLDWKQGLLLGAIVSSTDAAAVFAGLDARSVRLRPRVRALLELESGSNDPMAVFLTLGFVQLIMESWRGCCAWTTPALPPRRLQGRRRKRPAASPSSRSRSARRSPGASWPRPAFPTPRWYC
jgi:cell volume regulation protein A